MASRRYRVGQIRRSQNGNGWRGGPGVGLGITVGAFFALGLTPLATAPRANADIEDLFQPVIDAIAQAVNVVDPGLASSLDPGLDAGGVAAAALPATVAENATIPLTVFNTDPVVDLSVGGGPDIPVVVDTGSSGLMIPWYDLGLQNLLNLGSPIGSGIGGYGEGLDGNPNINVFYLEYPETVNFGNGIVTAPTTVDLELFAYPGSVSDLLNFHAWSLEAYEGQNGADGVLGIGPDALGPGPSSVITALPGDLNEGVLINEAGGYLEFGPNPLTPYASVLGAPITISVDVSVGGPGSAIVPVEATTIDSGGTTGTIPADILVGNPTVGDTLSPGTLISVYTSDDQLLYYYTTSAGNSPTISSGTTMNTGWEAFQLQPIYISYSPSGLGTTFFDE